MITTWKLSPSSHGCRAEVRAAEGGAAGDKRAGYEEARRAIELGAMVRQLRLDAGPSQEELARRAGMTQPALSRLERGGGIPTITVLDRIANALQATLTVSMTRAA
jgi:HTH-type transcriptional regulator/antitoxin HipB